jgi:hypothetical protein
MAAGPAVADWRAVRRVLGSRRAELSEVAARQYGLPRAAGTALLCRSGWLPPKPVPLHEVRLRWEARPAAPAAHPAGPLTAHLRPDGYRTYAEAIGALDRPALFEDRACYRLLDAGPGELGFGLCRYFDGVNLGHAAAHELAAAWPDVAMARLPLRAALGDPCDLGRRAATVAVTTLTLRVGPDGASFLLHWRDPARVNHAGGMYQLVPAGIFQPVTGTPAALRADFSLWRCLVRELSEELLGTSEDYPARGGVLGYRHWPFHQRLAAAAADGGLAVWYLGAGVDPLTLATDLLTVAAFRAGAFDELFGGLVARNAEGSLVTEDGSAAIPFTEATVKRLCGGGVPMQPAGAAALRLAWQHRELLLGELRRTRA